jgi:acetoacetyl-CoA synthetase
MAVDVWDDDGHSLERGKGELVCTVSFPSCPTGFWNDSADTKLKAAYFDRFPGVWVHGDYVEHTEHDGYIVHGRSDAVLNPGGVRIGTAELYAQVEHFDEVTDAVCIGQQWQNDVRIVLFVVMRDGDRLTDELSGRIKQRIREHASPRHTPARILAVPDIPRTMSGKIAELAVRDVVHGRPVQNTAALANPEALAYFSRLDQLAD